MGYRQVILAACQCSYEDSFEVEDMLRNAAGGVLDHLSRKELEDGARSAYKDLLALRAEDPNWSPDPAMKAARQKRGIT